MRTITVPLIPVNLQDNGFHILVEIVVFGVSVFAVIDTGASRSVFDEPFLRQHLSTLDSSNSQQANTIFSSAQTLIGIIPTLKIGKLTLKRYETIALDLQAVNDTYLTMDKPAISAIIGGDILNQFRCKIDYSKMLLRLYR